MTERDVDYGVLAALRVLDALDASSPSVGGPMGVCRITPDGARHLEEDEIAKVRDQVRRWVELERQTLDQILNGYGCPSRAHTNSLRAAEPIPEKAQQGRVGRGESLDLLSAVAPEQPDSHSVATPGHHTPVGSAVLPSAQLRDEVSGVIVVFGVFTAHRSGLPAFRDECRDCWRRETIARCGWDCTSGDRRGC
ncbi:MAG: proteasome subunit alpha or beta [Mycobacterium sp.]|jgi:hypothetical protein|nr:proteasome subunit alpha or beta [Mycobacterium sp.]